MKYWIIWASGAGLTTLLVWLVLALGAVDTVWGAVAVVSAFALLWMSWPRRNARAPRRITAFVVLFTFASILPDSISFALQLVALVGAFLEWIFAPASERRGQLIVLLAGLIVGYWGLSILNPNVPNLDAGVLGFRKSALAVAGVVLGCAIQRKHMRHVEQIVIGTLAAAMAISVSAHLWFPAVEALSKNSDADIYTSLFQGESRLHGVFAGPFHAALAGLVLIGWALVRKSAPAWLRIAALLTGVLGGYLTLVRTSFVALALMILVFALLATSLKRFLSTIIAIALAASLGIAVARAFNADLLSLVGSIGNFATDGRFLNRLPEYRQDFEMINGRPIFGWGAGSAGDTLGAQFVGGVHVTAHNLILKILVEGGIIGFLLWLCLAIALLTQTKLRSEPGQLLAVQLTALFGMGLTGSGIEALPVTYLLFVLVGLCVPARRRGFESETETPRVDLRAQILS